MRAIAIIPLCVCLLSSASAKPPLLLNYQDGDGQYNFGYSDPLSMRTESRTVDGVTRGTYSYFDQNGAIQTTEYEAGKDIGFRVKATNLPEAPLPVDETPEVKNAREKHLQLVDEANRREEEEKRNLSLVKEATSISESGILESSAIPAANIAPIPQDKEAPSIIPEANIQSQPLPDVKAVPNIPLKEDDKSAQPLLPEPAAAAPQTSQTIAQKQQEPSLKDLPNQGSLFQPSVLPEQRAFAAQNPFLIPFLGKGFSFENTLPQQRDFPIKQGQEKISAENINSELRTIPNQSGISEQSAIPKQSTLPDQRALNIPGKHEQSGPQIQNIFSEHAFLNQNASPEQRDFSIPSGISPQQFPFPGAFPDQRGFPSQHGQFEHRTSPITQNGVLGQSIAPKQTPLTEQRAFPTQDNILEQQRLSIQGALRQQQHQQQHEFLISSGFSGQQGFPTQGVLLQQRTAPTQTALPRPQGFPTPDTRPAQSELLKQPAFPEQRTVLAQGGLHNRQVFPSAGGFFGQGFLGQNDLLRQQELFAQQGFLQQQTIPRQNVIAEQQVQQSAISKQQENAQQVISRGNAAPDQQVNSQKSATHGQQFIPQQSFGLEQQAIARQNAAPEQQVIFQQSPISGQQFIQQQSSILEQQVSPRQNAAPEQQAIPQQSPISGQQFIQQQNSILEQQSIPRQNAAPEQQAILQQSQISGQQLIQQQSSVLEQQAIPRQNVGPEQQIVPQQNAVSDQRLNPQQGSISEQQITPLKNVFPEQKVITQENAIPKQQGIPQQSFILDQQQIARQFGFPEQQLLGQQNAISGQQGIPQIGSNFEQQAFNPFFGQQGEIPNQNGISRQSFSDPQRNPAQGEIPNQNVISRQSFSEQQRIPAQAAIPEQRGTTPSQESLPKGLSIPDQQSFFPGFDHANLFAQPSNFEAVRVPEPIRLSPVMLPEPVKYTPEVMAAREAHFRAYAIAARLAEESDRNPQILKELLKGPAANAAQIAQRENKPENDRASLSTVEPTLTPITENLLTKSAEGAPGKLPEILPEPAKTSEQRIEPLATVPAQAVEARKIDSAEKLAFNLPNSIEQPKVRTGLTPASTSLRVMDTRLPTLNEFQQSKLKEALALTCDTSLKVTEDKETKEKTDRHILIVKPVELAPIANQKDSPMQQPALKNWAFQYVYL